MAKLLRLRGEPNARTFLCPGCGSGHMVTVFGRRNECGATWGWNGDEEKPTFSPSILAGALDPASRCHSFVREGRIRFLDDCFHELRGREVELPDWDSPSGLESAPETPGAET